MKIGIVGQGFVGTAVREGLQNYHKVNTFDLVEESTCKSLTELVEKSKVIFVCVPTPMNSDGSCNTSIVENVVKGIDEVVFYKKLKNIVVVIKSTIPAGTTERLNGEHDNIQIVFNPEFLTEANSIDDFKNQNRIIIGGPRPASTKVRQLFYKAFPKAHIIKTHSTIAEMVKYMTNTFLATNDERLGKSHWAVPGPDGHYGFGGSCFPKDLNAIIDLCYELEVPAKTLFGAWETNLKVRPERDWENLKGRAVIEE